MRTILAERHIPRFAALSPAAAALTYERLKQHNALPLDLPVQPETGEELYELCKSHGLDHAGVVLTLSRETSPIGLAAIEALVGKPIYPWAAGTAQAALAAQPKPRGVAVPRVHETDNMIVVHIPSNPKRPNTAGWERYNIWKVGYTVKELKDQGLWPADVKWELERNTVQLAKADSPEGQAAIAKKV